MANQNRICLLSVFRHNRVCSGYWEFIPETLYYVPTAFKELADRFCYVVICKEPPAERYYAAALIR